jgi:SpoVK/Ycf46/Vps4 family AAA+-type ATPase
MGVTMELSADEFSHDVPPWIDSLCDYGDDDETDEDEKVPTLIVDIKNSKKTYYFDRNKNKTEFIDMRIEADRQKALMRINHVNDKSFIRDSVGDFALLSTSIKPEGKNVVTKIDNGFYQAFHSDSLGWYLQESSISSGDTYIDLGGELSKVEQCTDNFYNNEALYESLGMKKKLGVLLYGNCGTGKTYMITHLMKKYLDKAVIIFIDAQFPTHFVKKLKAFDQKYIFIFEELTQNISNEREMSQILLFLDGENSLNQQLVFATTNYPEQLPTNLASRPGRFDKLFHIDNPSREVREKYLKEKLGEVSDNILKDTEGQSIAYLKEMIISSKINGTTLEDELKNNKARIKLVEKHFQKQGKALGLRGRDD